MKLVNTQHNRFKNTYDSEEIQFAISEKEQRHIMTMLRDQIYSDKILAPIREYCCNAFDANIEANKRETPIDIHIPNQMEAIWSVRDYGPGLTHEEIKNIFTKYGESTKRGSNDVTGCLGIGSKAAFAYTDQFTVETWKNNDKATYVAAINDNGDAIIHLANKERVAEPEGVRISIPIKSDDLYTFRKRTISFLRSIHLAGAPYNILNEDLEIGEITKHHEADDESWYFAGCSDEYMQEIDSGNTKIIMGHVAYNLDTNQLYKLKEDVLAIGQCSNLFIRMPLGSLSIAASRESLEYNEQTMAYLTSTLPTILKSVQEKICHNIIHADNVYEATKHFNSAHTELPYNLRKIITNLKHEATGEAINQNLRFHKIYADGSKHPMDCDEYEVKTLRTGKTQIKKAERQYLRPEHNTVLFRNDQHESKGKRGRRIKAYLTVNQDAQLIMINESWDTIQSSTMSSYADTIKKISEVEPLPINYSNVKNGIGVNGPSKASGELFEMQTHKIPNLKNINRDCFDIIEDTQQYWESNDDIYAVQINGFRLDGKDLEYQADKETNQYSKDLIYDLDQIIQERYDIKTNIVAYRPKHKEAFGTIERFIPFAIAKIKEELKGNPDFAWELLLKRTNVTGHMNESKYDNDITDLMPHLSHSKFTPLRNLASLWALNHKHNKDIKINKFDAMLHTLNINPESYTRKQIPDIKSMTQQVLDKHPILNWIKVPYYYRWDRDSHEEEKKDFAETLKTIIK